MNIRLSLPPAHAIVPRYVPRYIHVGGRVVLRNSAFVCFIVLSLSFALGGCSTISGRSGLPPTKCITVHEGDCVAPEVFTESTAELVEEYRLDENFQNQWGLSQIKADVAYSNLSLLKGEDAEPGAGVTIGFIDTGIDLDHPAFAGMTVTEEFTPDAVDETGVDDFSHGTAVASIAAGARLANPRTSHGVAWGADVAMFALTLGSGDGVYRPISVEGLAFYDAEDAALYEQALSWRDGTRKVDILNLSFGYQGLSDRYTEQELRDNYGGTIAALAQGDAEEKGYPRLGRRQLPWIYVRSVELGLLPVPGAQCGLGQRVVGPARVHRGAPRAFHRRGGVESGRRANCLLLQSLRYCRGLLHRGARRGRLVCLFRTVSR